MKEKIILLVLLFKVTKSLNSLLALFSNEKRDTYTGYFTEISGWVCSVLSRQYWNYGKNYVKKSYKEGQITMAGKIR